MQDNRLFAKSDDATIALNRITEQFLRSSEKLRAVLRSFEQFLSSTFSDQQGAQFMPNCKFLRQDGRACEARAMAGSDFCFFHDPAAVKPRRDAQQRGGRKKLRVPALDSVPTRDFDLSDPKDITKLLAYAVNRIVRGEIDPKCAYALGYLADCSLRAFNAGTLAERLTHLEGLQQVESNLSTNNIGYPEPLDITFEEADDPGQKEQRDSDRT